MTTESLIPIAISSQFDSTGEERVHVANYSVGSRNYWQCRLPEVAGALPDSLVGSIINYQYGLVQTEASQPVTVSITAGALPTGLTMSTAGLVTGTAIATGTFNFTITPSSDCGNGAPLIDSCVVEAPPPPDVSSFSGAHIQPGIGASNSNVLLSMRFLPTGRMQTAIAIAVGSTPSLSALDSGSWAWDEVNWISSPVWGSTPPYFWLTSGIPANALIRATVESTTGVNGFFTDEGAVDGQWYELGDAVAFYTRNPDAGDTRISGYLEIADTELNVLATATFHLSSNT